jgi:hypothetical protein
MAGVEPGDALKPKKHKLKATLPTANGFLFAHYYPDVAVDSKPSNNIKRITIPSL